MNSAIKRHGRPESIRRNTHQAISGGLLLLRKNDEAQKKPAPDGTGFVVLVAGTRLSNHMQIEIEPFPLLAGNLAMSASNTKTPRNSHALAEYRVVLE
jgi:hypothetical protein